MKSDHPEDSLPAADGSLITAEGSLPAADGSLITAEGSLNELLNELSFEPAGALAVSHQAPAGLRQRILAQHAAALKPHQRESAFTHWFRSPWRAIAASAAPLLLGILLGSNTTATEFYDANIDPQSYPDNDQLLVIASLDSDFTTTLGQELLLDWPQDGEMSTTPTLATPTDPRSPGATTP